LAPIINKILFVWGQWVRVESHWGQKVGTRFQPLVCFHYFFLNRFFLIFASFLKLNLKTQLTIDEHRHKILVFLVLFMTIPQEEKIETPSIIHKQTQNFNKRKGKWRKMKWKRSRRYKVWFTVYFDPTMWISSNQQYFITTTLASRVANWPPKLIDILFRP